MVDKDRFEDFLRSLLGAFSVAWLLVALSGPGSVFAFSLRLAVTWVIAAGVAYWLVYDDGWASLHASSLFRPVTRTSTATLVFVLLAVLLKLAATAGTIYAFDETQVPLWVWLAESALAILLAYAIVFMTGPASDPDLQATD